MVQRNSAKELRSKALGELMSANSADSLGDPRFATDLTFRSVDPVAAAAKSAALDERHGGEAGDPAVELALLRDALDAATAAREEAAASLTAAQTQLEQTAAKVSS